MNIAELLAKAARVHGDRPAVEFDDRIWTYADLDQWSGRLASGLLDMGTRSGDRVVLWMRNRPELVALLFACFRAGLCAVPVNSRLHPAEVAYIVEQSGARVVLFDDTFSPNPVSADVKAIDVHSLRLGDAMPPTAVAAESPAWLFYTSGTTGRPKGATLTHRNLVAATMNCLADIHSFQPEEVVLHAAPLTHGSGLYMLPILARGAHNLIFHHPSFDPPEIFQTIEQKKVSAIAFLAPTMIVKLLGNPTLKDHDLSTLRFCCYGGGPMYVPDIKRAVGALGQIWVQLYGQGESPMTGTYLRAADHRWDTPDAERRLSSIGIPRTDVELRVIDADDRALPSGEVGEIVIRGETVMVGYWDNEAATAQALRGGWLHTGDLGYIDAGGYVFLVDRAKDMIISSGNNIYAREVEEAILTHPAVAEVAVIGLPDPYWGESVYAVVVVREGGSLTAEEVIKHVKGRIASYKKPKTVEFVAELPKSAYGKVLKRELRQARLTPSPPPEG